MIYPIELRERVISYIEQGGKKLHAAQLFKVARSTIDKWMRLKKNTGTLKAPPLSKRKWRKLCQESLVQHITANPDGYLADYAAHFNVSETGIWRALKRLNITRKKRRISIKKETKKNDLNILRN